MKYINNNLGNVCIDQTFTTKVQRLFGRSRILPTQRFSTCSLRLDHSILDRAHQIMIFTLQKCCKVHFP